MGAIGDFFRALAGRCDTQPLDPGLWQASGSEVVVQLGRVEALREMGSAVYLSGPGLDQPLLVVNSGPRGFLAYENRCTHGGRKLDPRDDGQGLRCCSLGHSTFDADGNHTGGPAKGPLKTYPAVVDGEQLVISLEG